ERVWVELQSLGPAVREEPIYAAARKVATETMRRVRRDCELLVSRLRDLGYVFGTYPDGSTGYYTQGPLVRPSETTRGALAKLEDRVGPIPISLYAFWQEVGSVDLVGMRFSWPEGLDPLVVYEPEVAISDLDDWEIDVEEGMVLDSWRFKAGLAPDELHKDKVSGGASYRVALPDKSADILWFDDRQQRPFVPYPRPSTLRR